jgi:hypothetical protein
METQVEFLSRRAHERAVELTNLEKDPLILAVFERPRPLPPLPSPMQPGGFFRRQAG